MISAKCDNHPDREAVKTIVFAPIKVVGGRPPIGIFCANHVRDLCEECYSSLFGEDIGETLNAQLNA